MDQLEFSEVQAVSTGLILPKDLSFETWRGLLGPLRVLCRQVETMQWMVGDWLNFGREKFAVRHDMATGQFLKTPMFSRYMGVVDQLGIAEQTAHNWCSVSKSVPQGNRRGPELLSWSHHQALQDVESEEQVGWLDRAIEQGWTVGELRKAIADAKAGEDRQGEFETVRPMGILLTLGRVEREWNLMMRSKPIQQWTVEQRMTMRKDLERTRDKLTAWVQALV